MATPDADSAPLELKVTGTFDLPAARRVCGAVILAGRVPVVLDLAQAPELRADALALLARALRVGGVASPSTG